jgi:hypothetical protein
MGIVNRRNAMIGWVTWRTARWLAKDKARKAVPAVQDRRPNKPAVAAAGAAALARMESAGTPVGPVALSPQALAADDRALFFVATRGAPADEDEWWSCHLDCEPDDSGPVAGLRWHTRGSFVVAPPSRSGRRAAQWIREPGEHPLPDALRPLEFLADACEEVRV